MNADQFRDRAAVWRQRAAERLDVRAREADLQLAEEYERLAGTLSTSATLITPDNSSHREPDNNINPP